MIENAKENSVRQIVCGFCGFQDTGSCDGDANCQESKDILDDLRGCMPTVEEMMQEIMKLSQKQFEAIQKAVNKHGLMNTDWKEIDAENGGSISFQGIAEAIYNLVMEKLK